MQIIIFVQRITILLISIIFLLDFVVVFLAFLFYQLSTIVTIYINFNHIFRDNANSWYFVLWAKHFPLGELTWLY